MYYERLGITAEANAGFAEALDHHTRPLKSYARRLTGNAADADDLVQETMLRCWSARHRFQLEPNFGAWSRVVMRNTFLSSHRRDRFHGNLPRDAFDRIEGTQGGQDLALDLRDVEWALDQLNPDERDAVNARRAGHIRCGRRSTARDPGRHVQKPFGQGTRTSARPYRQPERSTLPRPNFKSAAHT